MFTERLSLSTTPRAPIDFVNSFFSNSSVPLEQRNDNAAKLLRQLQNAGYKIDDKRICFGENGEHWPLLIDPTNKIVVHFGSVGVRGGTGKGSGNVLQYLTNLVNPDPQIEKTARLSASIHLVSGTHEARSSEIPSSSPVALPTESVVRSTHKTRSKHKEVPEPTPSRIKTCPRKVINTEYIFSSTSLQDLRERGIFKEPPIGVHNTFIVKDFIDSQLYYCHNDKFLVVKNHLVIACSYGMPILPIISHGLYDHGNGLCMPIPCKEPIKVMVALKESKLITEILPYLNSIPRVTYLS